MIFSFKPILVKRTLLFLPFMLFFLSIQAQSNLNSQIWGILKLESKMQSNGELFPSLQINKPTVLKDLKGQTESKVQQTVVAWHSNNSLEVSNFIKEIENKLRETTSSVNTATGLTKDQEQLLHLYTQELRFLKQK